MRKFLPALVCCSLSLLLLGGCGAPKEHGHVTGVVKINGEPVQGASVTFAPKDGGRSAVAETGADGSYELSYTAGVKGAKIGTNTLTLSTYASPTLDDDNKEVDPGKPERFPPEYTDGVSVTVDVQAGENTFDFDVEADQESYAPSGEEN